MAARRRVRRAAGAVAVAYPRTSPDPFPFREEYLIYHPNAAADGREAKADAKKKAALTLDLRASQATFTVEWYRAEDGTVHDGGTVEGGQEVRLVSPWVGHDVVLRLSKPRRR